MIFLPVEMGSLSCCKKSISRTHVGGQSFSGNVCWTVANRKDCPRFSFLPWKKLFCLHQAQNKGWDPQILCHWFRLYQSLLQTSLFTHGVGLVCVPGCALAAAVLRPTLGPSAVCRRPQAAARPAWVILSRALKTRNFFKQTNHFPDSSQAYIESSL